MKRTGTVTAVIPHWNRARLLSTILSDLCRQTHPLEAVIVVDNGSTDESRDVARAAGARFIGFPRNEGFARAVNLGVAACASEWVLIVNNDVSFGPNWLRTLLDSAVDQGAWFAIGKLVSAATPTNLDGTRDALCLGGAAWRCGHGRPDGPVWNEPLATPFLPLTAALVRRDLFDEVGGLDETFESYLEDVDLGLRCAAQLRTGVYVPGAVAAHAGSATLGAWHKATVRRISRNQLFLIQKHFRGAPLWPVLVAQLLWGLVAFRHGAGMAWLAGKIDGFRSPVQPIPGQWGRIRAAVAESEGEILRLQRATGFDAFWKAYFALVRS